MDAAIDAMREMGFHDKPVRATVKERVKLDDSNNEV